MGKTSTYLILTCALILIFHFFGLIQNTASSYLLGTMGITNPANLHSSALWGYFVGIGALTAVGLVVGLSVLGRGTDLLFFTTTIGIAAILVTIAWDLLAVYNSLAMINKPVASIVTILILIPFGLTIYEWARGTAT